MSYEPPDGFGADEISEQLKNAQSFQSTIDTLQREVEALREKCDKNFQIASFCQIALQKSKVALLAVAPHQTIHGEEKAKLWSEALAVIEKCGL